MATSIVGLAPVSFVSEDSATVGVEYQIPLGTLKYDAVTGTIDPSDWGPAKGKKLAPGDAKLLGLVLADLRKRGILSVEPAP